MSAVVYRRFALLLVPCALACGATDAESVENSPSKAAAAPTALQPAAGESACDRTDPLSLARCKQAELVRSTCDDVPDAARGHCVRCLLANNPMSCGTLPAGAAAQCRAQESAIAACADGPVDAVESCLRDAGMTMTARTAVRGGTQPRLLNSRSAP